MHVYSPACLRGSNGKRVGLLIAVATKPRQNTPNREQRRTQGKSLSDAVGMANCSPVSKHTWYIILPRACRTLSLSLSLLLSSVVYRCSGVAATVVGQEASPTRSSPCTADLRTGVRGKNGACDCNSRKALPHLRWHWQRYARRDGDSEFPWNARILCDFASRVPMSSGQKRRGYVRQHDCQFISRLSRRARLRLSESPSWEMRELLSNAMGQE